MRSIHCTRAAVGAVIAALAICAIACATDGGGGGGGEGVDAPAPVYAVMGAFPAELAALLERAEVDATMAIGERTFRLGALGGARVILGMTGIGLVNATATTRALLERVDVAGVIVSGVAGSPLRIGDVAVAERWGLAGGTVYAVTPEWVAVAEQIAVPGAVALERCTERPDAPADDDICLPQEPAIVVGGFGESGDPFGGESFACAPQGGEVFGCDVESTEAASSASRAPYGVDALAVGTAAVAIASDMETAAIAAETAARGVPFIAFRAVSDGEGDPLGLPGFPSQFFAYYRLAARNAAAATTAFLERLSAAESARR